jgi:parvulin-like peptidyl-prolyl isomerase
VVDVRPEYMKGGRWKRVTLAAVAVVAAGCGTEASEADLVARVDEHQFTVAQAVELLVNEERLAANADIVTSLAELWMDYTLLAAEASRDTMFSDIDLEPLVMQQLAQVMVFQLRDSVIQIDTFITESELRTQYASEAPEVEVRARHIMLTLPVQATTTQRDSAVAGLRGLRERIVAGESFETLARQFSQDPGSAAAGGDLGFFKRGELVAPFEEAALALEPGEVSDVVATPMGLHLIRVDERRVRDFDDIAAEYRLQVQARMVAEAEGDFIEALEERADQQVTEGAIQVVRELATNPGSSLARRARRRALLEWDGGAISVADVQQVFQLESEEIRFAVAEGTDEEVEAFLTGLGRRDLLIREARAAGLQPGRDSINVLVGNATAQLRDAARMLGLLDLDQAPGEDARLAVARAVDQALVDNLTGATQVVPLGLVGFQLREGTSRAVLGGGVGQVVLDVAQIRATRGLSPVEQTLDSIVAAADTVAR